MRVHSGNTSVRTPPAGVIDEFRSAAMHAVLARDLPNVLKLVTGLHADEFSILREGALEAMVATLRGLGDQDDDPSALHGLADEVRGRFSELRSIALAERMAVDDDDTERRLLAGQKRDGSWLVFQYLDGPA